MRVCLCQMIDQWGQYGSRENRVLTPNSRKVEHSKQEGTQRVQGNIGLSHLSYVLQINTWRSREFVSTSDPIGFEEVRD